jgi:hypothetical protein
MDEFRQTERALGVALRYGRRTLARSGSQVDMSAAPAQGAITRLLWSDTGEAPEYVMRAVRGEAQLWLEFDNSEIQSFFDDRSGLGERGEVFLTDSTGRFVTKPRFAGSDTEPERAADCGPGPREVVDVDYRGEQGGPIGSVAAADLEVGPQRLHGRRRELFGDEHDRLGQVGHGGPFEGSAETAHFIGALAHNQPRLLKLR